MINTKLQSIIDTKSAIGNAITNKGGTITTNTPFFNYAAQIDGISTGTPQTIFAASDGSKWALTNAVNLVNDAGNVTSDFNWWQPANNGTSDPILNVGTVGANISGNIQLVPVNQVNIAQYENIVINDTTSAKYVGYNGYDSVTNPTPTGNVVFNRWVLNNSASGTIVFANTTVVSGGTFNGPNTSINQANMAFINNTAIYGGTVQTITTNNGFIYVGGFDNQRVQKFVEGNLTRASGTNVSNDYGGRINTLKTNNGFIYAGGVALSGTNRGVSKFYESNLALVGNTVNYGGTIETITINNGFIYVGGATNRTIQKFNESTLSFTSNSVSFGGDILSLKTNNGFIYAGGETSAGSYTNGSVKKYHESNLAEVGNTANYGGWVGVIAINNGFIYVGGATNTTIQKYYESNLAFVGNTASFGRTIRDISTRSGFIYAGGFSNSVVSKFYESNLAFVANTIATSGDVRSIATNDSFIYIGGATNETIRKFQEAEIVSYDNITTYSITSLKE
jgi:hypothetical protein